MLPATTTTESITATGSLAESSADEALRRDAQVNPAGKHRAGRMQWAYFLLLNAIAGAIAVALFVGIFYAEGLDPYLQGSYQWLLSHPGVTSAMAFSPLACSLLVGWGYSQRARKRKALAAKRASKQGDTAVPSGTTLDADRKSLAVAAAE